MWTPLKSPSEKQESTLAPQPTEGSKKSRTNFYCWDGVRSIALTVTKLSSDTIRSFYCAAEFVQDRARVGTERQELMRMSAAFTIIWFPRNCESALMETWLSPQQAHRTPGSLQKIVTIEVRAQRKNRERLTPHAKVTIRPSGTGDAIADDRAAMIYGTRLHPPQ